MHCRISRTPIPHETRTGKEALFTKWLDVVQGNDFALLHHLYETIPTRTEQAYHIRSRDGDMLHSSDRLMGELKGRKAQEELMAVTTTELKRCRVAGYCEYVADGVGQEEKP